MDKINNDIYKSLISKVKILSQKEKLLVLNILKNNNISFTKNSNGFFFNLYSINQDIIEKIVKCIELVENNRDELHLIDKNRNSKIEYYKLLIEEKLNKTIKLKKNNYIEKLYIDEPIIYIKKKHLKKTYDFDPDILMKEYKNKYKYKKNTLFYRISQVFSNKVKHYPKENDDSDSDTNEGAEEPADNDIENHNVSEHDDIKENDTDDNDTDDIKENDTDDDKIDDDEKIDDEIDDVDDNENIEEEIYKENDEIENESDINTHTDTQTDTQTDTDNLEYRLEYYKKLLNINHGYSFDYDKNVKMQTEPYVKYNTL